MERTFRYDRPTQVKFLDMDADEVIWQGGIAFGANIICGECGGLFEIADIYADWDEVKDEYKNDGIESPIIPYSDWVDISAEILGE